MELKVQVKASLEEMHDFFEFDDLISVRFFKQSGIGVFSTRVRIPDCNMEDILIPISVSELKEKVFQESNECGNIILSAMVTFENGQSKKVYGSSEYWLKSNAESYAKILNTNVKHIENL